MSRKRRATKTETQAAEKPPIDLSDDQLDMVQGGVMASAPGVDPGRALPLATLDKGHGKIEIRQKLRVKFALDTARSWALSGWHDGPAPSE